MKDTGEQMAPLPVQGASVQAFALISILNAVFNLFKSSSSFPLLTSWEAGAGIFLFVEKKFMVWPGVAIKEAQLSIALFFFSGNS